jgi:diacylglycerol kinase (ATP)
MEAPKPSERKERVALIVNRHSRMARKNPHYIENLERAFGDRGPFIASQTPSELPAAISDMIRASPNVVFISGGDGTLRQTLSHLITGYGNLPLPKIAVLRGGTMNTVATSLDIHRDPIEQLEYVLYRHDRGEPMLSCQRTLLNVNGHYGFIFALGGFSKFIEKYQTNPDPTPRYAFKLLSRTIFSILKGGFFARSFFSEFDVNIWRDQQPWLLETKVTNVSASATRHIGFHFKPYFGAEEAGGTFGVLIFKNLPRRLIFHLPKIYMGKPISDPTVLQVPAHDLLIKVNEPMRPMLDGDILKADQTFRIQNGPELTMVQG